MATSPTHLRPAAFAALIATAIGFGPLVLALGSAIAARALGCRLDEGSIHPCALFGRDIGELLYAGGMMLWLFMLSAPIAAIGIVLWIVLLVRSVSARRSKKDNQ